MAAQTMKPDLSDPNDPFYEYPAMAKKDHLAIQEIYQYQAMSSAEISSVFFQLGVQKGATIFHKMLTSFKIAARAANAGWSLLQAINGDVTVMSAIRGDAALHAALKGLQNAMHDYSPDNFHPHAGDVEFAADCFEQFFNEASVLTTKEEVEELLFQWTSKLKAQAAEKTAINPTIQEVVKNAKARRPVTGVDQ